MLLLLTCLLPGRKPDTCPACCSPVRESYSSVMRPSCLFRAGAQQRRALGDLPYKPNKFLEDWGTAREHIELTYRWDGKTLRNVAMWMVAFPYIVYNITCFEFQKSDNKFGRTTRHFWGFD